jgi:hypothetical protein
MLRTLSQTTLPTTVLADLNAARNYPRQSSGHADDLRERCAGRPSPGVVPLSVTMTASRRLSGVQPSRSREDHHGSGRLAGVVKLASGRFAMIEDGLASSPRLMN